MSHTLIIWFEVHDCIVLVNTTQIDANGICLLDTCNGKKVI